MRDYWKIINKILRKEIKFMKKILLVMMLMFSTFMFGIQNLKKVMEKYYKHFKIWNDKTGIC